MKKLENLFNHGDMAIARKNKDLAEVFLSIVTEGKPVYLKDKELVENTIKTIKNLHCPDIVTLMHKITELQEKFQKEMKNPENALVASAINNGNSDIYSMIGAILDYYVEQKTNVSSVDSFLDFISDVFVTEPSDNAVIVSSIHQVKGLEAKTVFIVNYNLMPYTSNRKSAEENIQEKNLRYIAVTRAKEILYRCEGEETEDEKKYRGNQKEIDEAIENAKKCYDSYEDFNNEDGCDYEYDFEF